MHFCCSSLDANHNEKLGFGGFSLGAFWMQNTMKILAKVVLPGGTRRLQEASWGGLGALPGRASEVVSPFAASKKCQNELDLNTFVMLFCGLPRTLF